MATEDKKVEGLFCPTCKGVVQYLGSDNEGSNLAIQVYCAQCQLIYSRDGEQWRREVRRPLKAPIAGLEEDSIRPIFTNPLD